MRVLISETYVQVERKTDTESEIVRKQPFSLSTVRSCKGSAGLEFWKVRDVRVDCVPGAMLIGIIT